MSKLYSEKLREKYGDIMMQIIHQDEMIRESYFISKDHKKVFMRAVVFFGPDIEKVGKIERGKPLGEAIKSKDYTVKRQQIDSFMIRLSRQAKRKFKTKKAEARAVTIRLFASKKHDVLDIGRIIEIYNPDFEI